MSVWLIESKLFLNKEKTEVVLFRTSANLLKVTNDQLHIDKSPLKRVNQYKYLGVILNVNLTWNVQIENIAGKVGKGIGMLQWIRRNLIMNAVETVDKLNIHPFVEYCDWVRTCCSDMNKKKGLEKLQRRAARMIIRFTRSDEAMDSLRWDTLESKWDVHVFNLVNQSISGKVPHFL